MFNELDLKNLKKMCSMLEGLIEPQYFNALCRAIAVLEQANAIEKATPKVET